MKVFFLIAVLFAGLNVWSQHSAVGKWKTIDDDTNKPKSIVEIFEKDGKLFGKVEKLFKEPNEDQNPKCDKCTGNKKDQYVIGMEIMTDLKKDSDTKWSGGEILDPKNGKIYSCKIELIEDGQKLKVRGFIGFSMLGRTQVWLKEPVEAGAQEPPAETKNKSKDN